MNLASRIRLKLKFELPRQQRLVTDAACVCLLSLERMRPIARPPATSRIAIPFTRYRRREAPDDRQR